MSQTRPNILFILIDDMGWTDLSCCGSEYYETPNIDSLCAEGMRFTDGYAACPVCSPTRASLLTGKYPATVGITDWIHWGDARPAPRGRVIDVRYLRDLPTSETSIASALRDGGYATWHVGKWHLGGKGHLPQDHGFDVNVGGCHMGSPGQGGYFSPWTIEPLVEADVPAETYLTDYLTDRAVDLIDHVGETPFFLNLSYYSVHTPIQAKAERIARYEDKARRLGLDRFDTFVEGEFFPCEHKKGHRVRRRLLHSDPVYAAMIDSLDEGIGRVLAALERNGKARDTIVVFTSDNGGLATSEGSPTCNAPLAEGKGWMYEGGTREPLFVRWPEQIAAGSSCATPVTSPDFYPTLLEAAGLPLRPEQHVDGVSILPLLRGGDTLEREGIFWHYPHYGNQGGTPGSSVRCDDWKLIEFFEDGRRELYHLRDDISEERNLAADHPDIERDLYERLAVWRESVEAKIPEPNPAWNP
ncbi:MAG TPA: sulfatase [Candidatus Latescibacteria bacterium]|nr:sulfatase [Candidatus Latescibacterota bacterium]HJP30681.1 sulfatase [Candidatus Latescibacterota bacterium]